jgi:hypothetical protein
MRALVLIGLVGAAACGGDPQIVLELTGEVPRAERIEVLLLEPVVLAKLQLHNGAVTSTTERFETVFYMAERSRTSIELAGAAAGLRFEVQGAGGPYVPLVAARTGDQLLALGLHDPASVFAAALGGEHRPAAVSPVGDVTIYPIQLEPVDRVFALAADAPQLVKPREVLIIPCGNDGAAGGLAWRRADRHQLRVVTARGGEAGKSLLEPPDLDCDRHSPGAAGLARHVPGDELDCDDTAPFVHGGARERCTAFDDDCDPKTTLAPTPCAQACPGPLQICACDSAGADNACIEPLFDQPCKLPAKLVSGAAREPCKSAGPLGLPLVCQGGCEVMLAWAPPGLEVTIADEDGQVGRGLGAWTPIADGKAFLTVKATRSFSAPLPPLLLRIKANATISNHAVPLALFDAPCVTEPDLLDCPL